MPDQLHPPTSRAYLQITPIISVAVIHSPDAGATASDCGSQVRRRNCRFALDTTGSQEASLGFWLRQLGGRSQDRPE